MSGRVYRAVTPIAARAVASVARYRLRSWCGAGSSDDALDMFRAWCRAVCERLDLAVEMSGPRCAERCAYIANHRSYLDIPLLGAVLGEPFLSRADLAGWPIVGAAARAIHTVFIERSQVRGRAQAARALLRHLGARSLIVFPEGTTSGERLPRPFSRGLFRLLQRAEVPVVPVTIRYSDRRCYWTDASPLTRHLDALLDAGPPRAAAVHLGVALRAADFDSAEALARASHAAVCAPIEAFGELVVP